MWATCWSVVRSVCVVWEVVNSGGTSDSDRFRESDSSAKVCEIEYADVAFTPLLRATEDPMCPRRYKKHQKRTGQTLDFFLQRRLTEISFNSNRELDRFLICFCNSADVRSMFGPREDLCRKCKSPTLCIRFQGNGFGLLVASVRPCLVEKMEPTYVQVQERRERRPV